MSLANLINVIFFTNEINQVMIVKFDFCRFFWKLFDFPHYKLIKTTGAIQHPSFLVPLQFRSQSLRIVFI